jgi:hypothetical protein
LSETLNDPGVVAGGSFRVSFLMISERDVFADYINRATVAVEEIAAA